VTDANGATLGIFINQNGFFRPLVTYPTDQEPRGIAVGDLDGDGALDLVVANATTNTLGVFMGLGDGGFLSQVSYLTGNAPVYVSIADFDGDGRLDVAVALLGDRKMVLFHGIGDGGLVSGVPFAVGGEPFALLTADFHSDGANDLAATIGLGVTVMLNQGDGGFAISFAGAGSAPSRSLSAGDWNGDGHPDLAVTYNDADAGLGILLGNGDGTFAPEVFYDVGVAAGTGMVDLDGDGTTDLLFACKTGLCILWQGADGGVSGSIPIISKAGLSSPLVAADFNHDGAPDVAARDIPANGVSVYLNACP
jgi:hypothetical protein